LALLGCNLCWHWHILSKELSNCTPTLYPSPQGGGSGQHCSVHLSIAPGSSLGNAKGAGVFPPP
jgi:hypothetical protein